MYSLVLAGGFATRLWPITKDYPKPLLRLGKKRIIEFALEGIANMKRIHTIFISSNAAFRDAFKTWMETSEYGKKIKLILEPSMMEEEKLGAIRGIQYDIEQISKDFGIEDLLILAGDNVFSLDLEKMVEMYEKKKAPIVAVRHIDSLEEAKRFAVVETDEEDRIIDFKEKPKKPRTNLVATAIYMLPKDCVKYISIYLAEGGNPDAPGFFFEWLTKKLDVYAYKFSGYWFDIGTQRGYFEALTTTMRDTYISKTANIEGEIIHPVYIGENVRVDDKSRVGPWVVLENGAEVYASQIEKSLVMENTIIKGAKLTNVMVGKKAKINNIEIENSILASYTKINLE